MSEGLGRAQALAMLEEWTKGESLRKHGMAVSVCPKRMGGWRLSGLGLRVRRLRAFVESYASAGLLHDMDYERHPSLEEHPFVGVKHLRELGWPEDGAACDSGACGLFRSGAGVASGEGAVCLR